MCSREPESTKSHKKELKKSINFAILTISTSKFKEEGHDISGNIISGCIEKEGHVVAKRDVANDEINMIKEKICMHAKDKDIDIIVTTGGTGLAKRDVTIEAVKPLFEKEISGFNPIFMHLSHNEIGPACMLSGATAGIIGAKAIFCLPGSPDACALAMEKIILKEAGHILKHAGE
ncbi:MAG: molybdenum cofactor biosynthesis protein B [archaeon]|nr:molybdenum cofactor biosynthesis protein B [archaeon]